MVKRQEDFVVVSLLYDNYFNFSQKKLKFNFRKKKKSETIFKQTL